MTIGCRCISQSSGFGGTNGANTDAPAVPFGNTDAGSFTSHLEGFQYVGSSLSCHAILPIAWSNLSARCGQTKQRNPNTQTPSPSHAGRAMWSYLMNTYFQMTELFRQFILTATSSPCRSDATATHLRPGIPAVRHNNVRVPMGQLRHGMMNAPGARP